MSKFSWFFQEASEEEKRSIIEEVVRLSNIEQQKIINEAQTNTR
jgi:hypothetical protein